MASENCQKKFDVAIFGAIALEVSPVIKSIASYLKSKNNNVEILVYGFAINRFITLYDIPIIELMPKFWSDLRRIISSIPRTSFAKIIHRIYASINSYLLEPFSRQIAMNRLKSRVNKYDFIIAAEWVGLNALCKVGYPLSKVLYLSLEAEDQMYHSRSEKSYINNTLSKCAFCIIQSKERREAFTKYLGRDFNFEYLPVSIRPAEIKRRSSFWNDYPIKIIYSGYIANFAYLEEFIEHFIRLSPSLSFEAKLEIQGQARGFTLYLKKILSLSRHFSNISIRENYINDSKHLEYLSQFDLGLALYKEWTGSSNWQNLLYSSGKIATYLWSGLAVMTNIRSSETSEPPFLYIGEMDHGEIMAQLEKFASHRREFYIAAKELAREKYNLDRYMDSIFKRILYTY